ncbi:hypothetical protein [Haloimpatiens lingqiaonensis]|uniref:hypothetical protein n=1 Tax=Haloimpatiens lingqiaonensis TaxID=1380675 RepID=UPI0010FEEDCF|nr:hypothetical protein [Haloimpatiens lingqiaonensis]
MQRCEVIKTKVVIADEIFYFQDTRPVNPGLGNLVNAPVSESKAKICVLACDVECDNNNKLIGTITFGICEDFTIETENGPKPVEYFFRVKKDFTFQKADCTDLNLLNCTTPPFDIDSLKCQIVRVKADNNITITPPDFFEQTLDIEVKIIVEVEKVVCVSLCQDAGNIEISTNTTPAELDMQ